MARPDHKTPEEAAEFTEAENLRGMVQAFRKSRGLSVNDWAKRAGLSETGLRAFLSTPGRSMSFANLDKLAYAERLTVVAMLEEGSRAVSQSEGKAPVRRSRKSKRDPAEALEAENLRKMVQTFRRARGLSVNDWAKRAGLSETGLRAFLSTPGRSISFANLDKLAHAERLTVVAMLEEGSRAASQPSKPRPKTPRIPANVRPAAYVSLPWQPPQGTRVPIYGTVQAGPDGAFEMNSGEALDWVPRPPGLMHNRTAYALYVEGDSMVPVYASGDLIFVSTSQKPVPGRDVIIETFPEKEGEAPRAYVKRVVRMTPDQVVVEQFNPPRKLKFRVRRIKTFHLVLKPGEIMGIS